MKKKLFTLALASLLLMGCAGKDVKGTDVESKENAAETTEDGYKIVSAEEFYKVYGDAIPLPENLENVQYRLKTDGDQISEITFDVSGDTTGNQYLIRIKQSDDINEDISGMDPAKEIKSEHTSAHYKRFFMDYSDEVCMFIEDRYTVDDLSYEVASWDYYSDGKSYLYALIVSAKDLGDYDITPLATSFTDCFYSTLDKKLREASFDITSFPDGVYSSDFNSISNISLNDDVVTVECKQVFAEEGEIPGAMYADLDEGYAFAPYMTISVNVGEITCGKYDADGSGDYANREANCSIDDIVKSVSAWTVDTEPPALYFVVSGGKVVKLYTLPC